MAFGLVCKNGADEFTLTSDTVLPRLLGTATYATTVAAGGIQPGLLRYTFTYASEGLMVGINLQVGARALIRDIRRVGSTYTIDIIHGFSLDSRGYVVPSTSGLTVYCFGVGPITPSGFGLALYNAAGECTAELSGATMPLWWKGRVSFAANADTVTAPTGFAKLGLIANPHGYQETTEFTGLGGTPWRRREMHKGWLLDASFLNRVNVATAIYDEDAPGATSHDRPAFEAYLVELNNY
jgi:hypothetical protein